MAPQAIVDGLRTSTDELSSYIKDINAGMKVLFDLGEAYADDGLYGFPDQAEKVSGVLPGYVGFYSG